MVNPNFFIHLTRVHCDELFVDYQAACLLQVMLHYQQNPLTITLESLAKIMRCSQLDVKSSLNFIQKCGILNWQFSQAPETLLKGGIVVNFNWEKIERISSNSWPKNQQKSHRTGSVYLVRNDRNGMIKIGRSLDVQKRIKALQTSNPFPLTLILTISTNDSSQVESNLHQIFHHKRINGEWFNLSNQDINFVSNLKQQIENPVIKPVVNSAPDLPF